MLWVGITGSWRTTSPAMLSDVEHAVESALQAGKGIITGGALGVDYTATATALRYAADGSRLKVILPTSLKRYARHYRQRAQEGVITSDAAESLIEQLEAVAACNSLVEGPYDELTVATYYDRNSEVIKASTELLAFQSNNSAGTQDTIDKARDLGLPVELYTYQIPH